MKKNNHGFTLLELLVVVMIIGLLTGVVAPRLMAHLQRSEVTTARAQLDSLDKSLQSFRIDMGRYPSDAEGLRAIVVSPGGSDSARWRGPYLNGVIPLDPWGSPYIYRERGTAGREVDLYSLGRDRAPGGQGDDADIRR